MGDVEGELADLFEKEILFHLHLEQQKLDFQNIPDYRLSRIFKMLMAPNRKYIDANSIRRYMKKMGHQVLT